MGRKAKKDQVKQLDVLIVIAFALIVWEIRLISLANADSRDSVHE